MGAMDIVGSTFFSVFSAGGIIIALSSWLGKVWANRILEEDRSKYGKEIENLRAKFAGNLSIQEATLASFGATHQVAQEIRLEAIKTLWTCLLDFRELMPATLFILDVCKTEEFDFVISQQKKKGLLSHITEDQLIAELKKSKTVEAYRPFFAESLWFMFYAYRAFMSRSIYLLLHDKISSAAPLLKDRAILQLIKNIIPNEQFNLFEKLKFGKIKWVQTTIETIILAESNKVISGGLASDLTLEQCNKISEAVSNAENLEQPN